MLIKYSPYISQHVPQLKTSLAVKLVHAASHRTTSLKLIDYQVSPLLFIDEF